MKEKFSYKNIMAVPKITKTVVNTGFGKLIANKTSGEKKKIEQAILQDLAIICGQHIVLTKAKKSIAGFKIREGMNIGAMSILRGQNSYDFLERLINIGIPRVKDFRGINIKSVDKNGNLTIAIKEHIIFPEIAPEKTSFIFGFEITIVSSAKTQEHGIELFKLMGFPIKKK